jgi:hypothetical protein
MTPLAPDKSVISPHNPTPYDSRSPKRIRRHRWLFTALIAPFVDRDPRSRTDKERETGISESRF